MQISLRSQMIAGTTAFVGATAIAMTPVAPAVSIPSISTAKAAVTLAAVANPLTALLDTAVLGLDYLFESSAPTTGSWQVSNVGLPVGPITNAGLQLSFLDLPLVLGGPRYLPAITNVGLVPNFITNPLPILSQVVANQLDYANTAFQAAGVILGAAGDILWSPVGLTIGIISDILAGDIALIPVRIQETISQIIQDVTDAVGAGIGAVQEIAGSIINNAVNVASGLAFTLGSLLPAITGQFGVVAASVQEAIVDISGNLAAGDIEGAFNAAVSGLLSPEGVPGTLLNLTLGAGVQLTPDVLPATGGTFVPSTRTLVQTLGSEVSGILAGGYVPGTPLSASSVRAAAVTSADAVEAAPAAEATAGDNSAAAEESTTAAPVASAAAADDSTSSDAPKKASKAGAARAGR